MNKTITQYNEIIAQCKDVFMKKTRDYGTAWRILRPSSITDQLFIKARRIRSIEENGEQKINDPIDAEFIGLINYSIIALIQLTMPKDAPIEMDAKEIEKLYDSEANATRDLMQAKNHDYGEVWRDMRVSSMTDLILQKLLRIKQIEDNKGKTIISEGLDANYRDILNYAAFALIKMSEE
jgi:muconolactone delta-isomerase